MKSHKALFLAIAVVLLAVLIGVGAALLGGENTRQNTRENTRENTRANTVPTDSSVPETTEADVDWSTTVEQDGVLYRLNPDLQTVLFLGADDGGTALPGVAPGEARRADTIFLLLLDNNKQEIQLVAISRDTIADVDVYTANGDYAYTAPTHITMQYFYGDSAARSCYLMKRAVSRLLYGMRIDGSLSLNAAGIVTIVDQLGGLTVTMPDDYTAIDPRYQAGAQLTLTGSEAEHLMRYRDTSIHGSNEDRVERQIRLIKALVTKLQASTGLRRLEELLKAAGDDVCSDLDAETLKKLVSYRLNPDALTLPGNVVEGEAHDEFYVDDSALRKLLIELYYQPVE